MNYPITRYPDSLILAKAEKIANALAKSQWRMAVSDQRGQLFMLEVPVDTKKPWKTNGVASKVAESSGATGHAFTLMVDGRHVFQLHRQEDKFADILSINREWFGGDEEASRLAYVEASDLIGAEFGVTSSRSSLPANLSDELGRFVETRDQGLARLEELYTRFTRKLLEDREQLAQEFHEREKLLLVPLRKKVSA